MKLDVTGNQANKNKQHCKQCLAKRVEQDEKSIHSRPTRPPNVVSQTLDIYIFLWLASNHSTGTIIHIYIEPKEFWRGGGIWYYDKWMQFVIGIPDASQCSPPGLAARRRRFLTLTPPWQESLVGLGRGVEVVRRGDEEWGEAETGRSGEGGNRWVFLSWHWLWWLDSFSGGLWNKRDFISAVTPL